MAQKTSPGQLSIFQIVPSTASKVFSTSSPVHEAEEQNLLGYGSGHPWYYKLGGKVLSVEAIRPAPFTNWDPIQRRRSGKPFPKLDVQLAEAKGMLARDIARYKQLIVAGDKACSDYDLKMGFDSKFNLSLKHNHIAYGKGLIVKLEEAIASFDF